MGRLFLGIDVDLLTSVKGSVNASAHQDMLVNAAPSTLW